MTKVLTACFSFTYRNVNSTRTNRIRSKIPIIDIHDYDFIKKSEERYNREFILPCHVFKISAPASHLE